MYKFFPIMIQMITGIINFIHLNVKLKFHSHFFKILKYFLRKKNSSQIKRETRYIFLKIVYICIDVFLFSNLFRTGLQNRKFTK